MFKLEVQFATKAELIAFLCDGAPATASAGALGALAAAGAVSAKVTEVKKPTAPKEEPKVETKVTTSSPKQEESVATGEQTTDYPTLQAAVFKAAKINKAATLAIATELGSATFKELAPALWGDALAKVQALIDQAEVA